MISVNSRKVWLLIFIAVQLGTVLAIISKNILWIQCSYRFQRDEKQLQTLLEEKKILLHKLHDLQRHDDLKRYAQDALSMQSVQRSKIKRINVDGISCL